MATILIFLTLVASWLLGFDVASPSILMGVGIAIDVMLATISKFRDDDLSFKNWTLPIMATHIGFPAVGYYGFWGATQAWPWLGPTFGIIGAVFVVLIHSAAAIHYVSFPFLEASLLRAASSALL